MNTKRINWIKENLNRGDQTKIAKKIKVGRRWVCLVLKGQGVSERVLQAAEELINSRKKLSNETANN